MSDFPEPYSLDDGSPIHGMDAKAATRGGYLVSYVVLSYNHKNYIQKTIDSIINQTYKNIELIVIDDGSTDGSVELLQQINKSIKFKLIVQENLGVVAALNRGVSESSGDFVVPHASDDVSELDRTENQLRGFYGDNKIGFVVGGIRKISIAGDVLDPWRPANKARFNFGDFIQGNANAIAVSCMYRGDLIRSVLPLDVDLPFEDVQLYWRITEAGYECFYDGTVCVVNYRILPNSLGRSNKIKLKIGFLRFIERYKSHPSYDIALAHANGAIFSELSEYAKLAAIKFYMTNRGSISRAELVRGCVKLLIPNQLTKQLKRKY